MTQKEEKSLWGYVLLLVSGLGTVFQILGYFSQGMEFVSKPYGVPSIIAISFASAIAISAFVLWRRKPGVIGGGSIPFYSPLQRRIATSVLVANVVIVLGIAGAWTYQQHRASQSLLIPHDKLGIAIAEFTEGPSREESTVGKEISELLYRDLIRRLDKAKLSEKVVVKRIKAIRSEEEAKQEGERIGASIIVWGWVPRYTERAFIPSFSFIHLAEVTEIVEPTFFEAEITGFQTVQLSKHLAARTTALTTFAVGLAFYSEGDYESSIEEFTNAIKVSEEMKKGLEGDELEEFEKSQATFYHFRGKAYVVTP